MKISINRPPLVSIIINNYNYERFVGQAIESALQQTYPNVEVIVVDDGSTDRSPEIIRGYHGRILPLIKENGGQSTALNAGFKSSHGEIIIFLDADDLLLPTAVEDVIDVFSSRPDLVRVEYRMAVIDENNRRTGVEKPEKHIPVPCGNVLKQALSFPFDMAWLPTSGNAFATWGLSQIMPIPEGHSGKVGADWYLVHLSNLLGPVFFLSCLEACYRVHSANNYERSGTLLDLEHIRQTIRFCDTTATYMRKLAKQQNLNSSPEEITSVSYLANRLVSMRLEPEQHPIPADTRISLLRNGVTAAFRRFDISIKMKLIFVMWFAITTVAPKRLVVKLARLFFYPELRGRFNKILARFHLQQKPSRQFVRP